MINLLPPIEKENLLMERIKRMVIILWFLAFFFLLCLILVFFAVMIYAKSQLQYQEAFSLQTREDVKQVKVEEFQGRVKLINSELAKLENFYSNKIYFSALVEKISKTLPNGVYLEDLSLVFIPGAEKEEKTEREGEIIVKKTKEPDAIEVSLAGFSPTRDLLFALKGNLEKEKDFVNIKFPPSNWVEEVDVDFSISFDINLNQ